MVEQQHISNLESFGYSADESRFLAVTALYSGYFVRRQFEAAIAVNRGKRSVDFVNKLLHRGHAQRYVFEHNRQVFHLQYKPFYEAVGDQGSRNRRERQPQTIKARLMTLDFVQAHPGAHFLATGQQKAALFQGLGIPADVLPAKVYGGTNGARSVRHFMDRSPIFTSASGNGPLDRICFTYMDSGFETGCAFATYLRRYKQLFQATGQFVIYVGTNRSRFGQAENIFSRVLSGDRCRPVTPDDLTRMLDYFRDWDLVQRGLSRSFSREKLDALRDAHDEFSSPFHEGLFEHWKQGGEAAVRAELGVKQVSQGRFVRYVLPFDYELFGDEETFS